MAHEVKSESDSGRLGEPTALLIGSWSLLLSTKGSVAHRLAGRAFAVLMAVTAATTSFIPGEVIAGVDVGPLVLAGLFTLAPGRIVYRMLFP